DPLHLRDRLHLRLDRPDRLGVLRLAAQRNQAVDRVHADLALVHGVLAEEDGLDLAGDGHVVERLRLRRPPRRRRLLLFAGLRPGRRLLAPGEALHDLLDRASRYLCPDLERLRDDVYGSWHASQFTDPAGPQTRTGPPSARRSRTTAR